MAVVEHVVARVSTEKADRRAYRLASVDMLRGLVIVVMALDHVRDYFNVGGEVDPMSNPGIGAALPIPGRLRPVRSARSSIF